MMQQIDVGQLSAEFEAVIRDMPNRKTIRHDLPENHEWLGRAAALVMLADPVRGIMFRGNVDKLYAMGSDFTAAINSILVTLQQFRMELRLKSGGPLTLAFEAGKSFDYFDEVRKIIESATSDLLVVDPYLGAEFIGRYLPFVKTGVTVRLLIENKITQVKEAVSLFSAQHGTPIELRKSKDMHDRFIFVDRRECYHSGATFKDGAVLSASILSQVTDAFPEILKIYEVAWDGGKI